MVETASSLCLLLGLETELGSAKKAPSLLHGHVQLHLYTLPLLPRVRMLRVSWGSPCDHAGRGHGPHSSAAATLLPYPCHLLCRDLYRAQGHRTP